MRVVLTNQLCDIVQAVHADELKHSGTVATRRC